MRRAALRGAGHNVPGDDLGEENHNNATPAHSDQDSEGLTDVTYLEVLLAGAFRSGIIRRILKAPRREKENLCAAVHSVSR